MHFVSIEAKGKALEVLKNFKWEDIADQARELSRDRKPGTVFLTLTRKGELVVRKLTNPEYLPPEAVVVANVTWENLGEDEDIARWNAESGVRQFIEGIEVYKWHCEAL